MDYFVAEYRKRDVRRIRVLPVTVMLSGNLLRRSLEIGADYIATGHYARVERLSNGRYAVRNSVTAAKDQTYALFNLTQEQLAHTLMPVGDYTKDEIRAIAEKIGLAVANKKRTVRKFVLSPMMIMRDLLTGNAEGRYRRREIL